MKKFFFSILSFGLILIFYLLVSCTVLSIRPTPTQNTISTQIIITSPSPSPSPALTPTLCKQSKGKFEFLEIQTTHLTHPLQFRVYLPACYGMEKNRLYPVLYILHGQSFNDDQWDRLGLDEALDSMIASGEVQPMIIVMPKESNFMNNQWDSKYGPALAEELVPWVDSHYQTCADRACRAIGGLSRGAGWAMRTGLIYWQTYGAIGAHSFAPFRGDFNSVPFWIKAISPGMLPHIWIDVGDSDFIADAARVWKDRLDDYNVPNEWHVLDGYHNEKYWSRNVDVYLKWYADHLIK
jgi:enterochelin esterase-like enzyme